ncbi:MAG: hypothetical protein HY270_11690 [Deltaproteobacteria bacterium]|nr:hypothetical protein [Deltaproteobacteria bacterium]
MKKKTMAALKEVHIQIDGRDVVAWEARDRTLHALGRWTDPKGLLRRIYELEHPEETQAEGPGRQWQSTWRGRFVPNTKAKAKKAA